MRSISITFALILTTPVMTVAIADVYRSVDDQGNVTFSDHASSDAKKVEVEAPNILRPVKPIPVTTTPDSRETPFKYELLQITTPENGTSLRNITGLAIAAQLVPNLRDQHRIRFVDNGTPLKEPTRSLAIKLNNVDRGTHQYQAQVLDEKGTVLISSEPVSVHIHKTSILHNKPRAAAP